MLVLSCGLDEEGLPFGLQIVGRYGEDIKLLSLGLALEAALAGDDLTQAYRPSH